MFEQLDDVVRTSYLPDVETTISDKVCLSGVGLHSGRPASIALCPAMAGTGIVFRRVDLLRIDALEDQAEALARASISACAGAVSGTRLGTSLVNAYGVRVATIEHLMASLAAYGIGNLIIELDGPEVPILDGSAAPFVKALEATGIRKLKTPRQILTVTRPFKIHDAERWVMVAPCASTPRIDVTVAYDDPAIGRQTAGFDICDAVFRDQVARARTFCNLKDVADMHAHGLGLGGSADNAILVDNGRVVNAGGLRRENEFAYHKALDLLGDLYLIGLPIFGNITAFKPGHALNTRFAQALLDSDCYTITTDETAVMHDQRERA